MSRRFSNRDVEPMEESILFKKSELRHTDHKSTKNLVINITSKDKNEMKEEIKEIKEISFRKRNSVIIGDKSRRESLLADIISNISLTKKNETKGVKKKKKKKKGKKKHKNQKTIAITYI